jgi:DNA primase
MFPTGRSSVPNDDRQRVLDATDIVHLIGESIALKPKGREFVCLCPFHDDHSPSMFVVPHKQMYHCFSCGAGGNALGFVMNYHKMTFREALEYLAERSGITLTPFKPQRQFMPGGEGSSAGVSDSSGVSREEMRSANATAQSFFRAILNHPEHGKAAREIIDRRAISPEMIDLFQLGAAPDKWDGLTLTVQAKNLPVAPFKSVGLFKQRENGPGHYDAFRNRLMFPIHDQTGKWVIGFGGRRINDEDEPKYINSPESALFDKGKTLYAMSQASQAIRQTRVAIVTEGYMDAIACHQAGVRNAVATLGTALTSGNARILRQMCDSGTIVLLFDGDEAGQRAAERAVEVFFSETVDVRIAMLSTITDAKDPDELLKRDGGREVFDVVIRQAIDPLELLFARQKTKLAGLGLSARGRAVDDFVARLMDLGLDRVDKVRYQLIIKRLGEIAGVGWDAIRDTIEQYRVRGRGQTRAPAATTIEPKGPLSHGEHLLGCLMNDPSLALTLNEDEWELLDASSFADPAVASVARIVADLTINERTPSVQEVMAETDDPRVQQAAARLAGEIDRFTGSDPAKLKQHWRERLHDAKVALQRGATGDAATGQDIPENLSLEDRIARLREQKKGMGNDPRAVPRPTG